MIPRIWENRTVFIVAGGPSLENFDWSRLANKNVLAINRSFEVLPFAQVLFWMDQKFFEYYEDELLAHKAQLKVTSNLHCTLENPETTYVEPTGFSGMELRSGKIREGKNSGYGALNLAYHLGARRFILMGYDMQEKNGKSHWHNGYTFNYNKRKLRAYAEMFPTIAPILKNMGIQVFNTNPDSAITCFEFLDLDKALTDF